MKKTLIFVIMVIMAFDIYSDQFYLVKSKLAIEDKKSKNNNKYRNEGTYIIIDKNNIKNSTANITKYKDYSKLNNLLPDCANKLKSVININPVDNKGVSHIFLTKWI